MSGTSGAPLRVCIFGAYRAEYSRNAILLAGLRRNGVQVVECHARLWRGVEDRVDAVSGGWKNPTFWWRVLRTYAALLRAWWPLRNSYDVLVCAYPGHFDVYLARILAWMTRKPLLWDVFMSIWLIARERGLHKRSPLAVALLRRVEWLALRLPDLLVIDTADYARWLAQTHGLPADSFALVPTGADSDIFHPTTAQGRREGGPFCVLYYGSYIPNHGVPAIIAAASLLHDDPSIHFSMIGAGPELPTAQAEAQRRGLTNITFLPWLEQNELRQHIADADLCLGAFGDTPQSLMTVQNKLYECLAMGKALLSGDGPAVRAALRPGEEIVLCPRLNPAALAEAIRTLRADVSLRARLGAAGRARFVADYTIETLGARYAAHLRALYARHTGRG